MDSILVNDMARAAHLLGMALGFGVALIADLMAARAVLRPLDDREIEHLEIFHRVVSMGLALLWGSGLTLLYLRTGFALDEMSPKLMAKLCVVALLTLNAVAIGRIGLPTFRNYQSWRFGDIPLTFRLQLSALATISGACWVSALSLGVFSQLRTLDWDALSLYLGVIYLLALVAALFAATISPAISGFAKVRSERPRLFSALPKLKF